MPGSRFLIVKSMISFRCCRVSADRFRFTVHISFAEAENSGSSLRAEVVGRDQSGYPRRFAAGSASPGAGLVKSPTLNPRMDIQRPQVANAHCCINQPGPYECIRGGESACMRQQRARDDIRFTQVRRNHRDERIAKSVRHWLKAKGRAEKQ